MLEHNEKNSYIKSNLNLLNDNTPHSITNNIYVELIKAQLQKELQVNYDYISNVIDNNHINYNTYAENYAIVYNFLSKNDITGIEFDLIMDEYKTFHYTGNYQKEYSFDDDKLTFTSYISFNGEFNLLFNKQRIFATIIRMFNHCYNKKYNHYEYYETFKEINKLFVFDEIKILNQKGSLKVTFDNLTNYELFKNTYKLITKYLTGLLINEY